MQKVGLLWIRSMTALASFPGSPLHDDDKQLSRHGAGGEPGNEAMTAYSAQDIV